MKKRIILVGALGAVYMSSLVALAAEPLTVPPIETELTIEAITPETIQIESEEFPAIREFTTDDAYILAKLAMAEAEGEDLEGKALVMMAALNRVESEDFPNSIRGVVFQKKQFSPVSDGRYWDVEPNEECYKALNLIKNGWDDSDGALFFESGHGSGWHKRHLTFLFKHGRHYFYK